MWQFLFIAFIFVTVVAFLKLNQNSRRHASIDLSKKLSTGDDFRFPIVGESSYQAAIRHAVSQEGRHIPLRLVPEDTNPYDHHAVKVVYRGTTMGYLSRHDARSLRQTVSDLGHEFTDVDCHGLAFGGTPEKPTFGIWLNISIPKA
ncbi:HIRAN domain-containing protein [Pandoraea bronchicola]|uniref:HIRAN domain-containing protein n=1 Tax=Pandoraea bronchicola TaxID=2508287 RepID=A0A5E5C1C9_9BURK|nr:HIRAN domain-containing protein [Pandoraea bronchicola]VVE90430.1 hypothetical protein PBR20603_04414 [Pandoraea bronchicola]